MRTKLMASGKIKWWDDKKGHGFIIHDTGQDVFVHHSSILGKGFKTFMPGDEVSYEVIATEKGLRAENVKRAEAS